MIVYFIHIEYRKGGSDILGPYGTREKANEVFLSECGLSLGEQYSEFNSDITAGKFYSEDKTVEIIERTLKD